MQDNFVHGGVKMNKLSVVKYVFLSSNVGSTATS